MIKLLEDELVGLQGFGGGGRTREGQRGGWGEGRKERREVNEAQIELPDLVL